jgi:curved DNA-binding protein CbpA
MGSIRSAYLQRIRDAHPDRSQFSRCAAGAFGAADINVAYGVLKDRLRRAQYDRHLADKRYPAVALQRIEPVPFHTLLITTLSRLLLITFVANSIRQLAARTKLIQRVLAVPTVRRSVRLARGPSVARVASKPQKSRGTAPQHPADSAFAIASRIDFKWSRAQS